LKNTWEEEKPASSEGQNWRVVVVVEGEAVVVVDDWVVHHWERKCRER